jgi:hypothetical protein
MLLRVAVGKYCGMMILLSSHRSGPRMLPTVENENTLFFFLFSISLSDLHEFHTLTHTATLVRSSYEALVTHFRT